MERWSKFSMAWYVAHDRFLRSASGSVGLDSMLITALPRSPLHLSRTSHRFLCVNLLSSEYVSTLYQLRIQHSFANQQCFEYSLAAIFSSNSFLPTGKFAVDWDFSSRSRLKSWIHWQLKIAWDGPRNLMVRYQQVCFLTDYFHSYWRHEKLRSSDWGWLLHQFLPASLYMLGSLKIHNVIIQSINKCFLKNGA